MIGARREWQNNKSYISDSGGDPEGKRVNYENIVKFYCRFDVHFLYRTNSIRLNLLFVPLSQQVSSAELKQCAVETEDRSQGDNQTNHPLS